MSKGEERQAEFEYERQRQREAKNHGIHPTTTTLDDIDFIINTEVESGNGGTYPKHLGIYADDEVIKRDIESMIAKCQKWLEALRTANEMKSAIRIAWYTQNAKHEFDRLYNIGLKFEAYFDGYFAALNKLKTK